MRRLLLLLVGLVAMNGCAGIINDHVRDEISRTRYCPRDSISVVARPDLRPSDFDPELTLLRAPDAEVLADPARRAVWEAARRQHEDNQNWRYRVFTASACGRAYLYVCTPMTHTSCIWGEEVTDRTPPIPPPPDT